MTATTGLGKVPGPTPAQAPRPARTFRRWRNAMAMLLFTAGLLSRAHAQTAPPVQVKLVPWANNIQYITAIASCGDGRLFAATQGGSIRIITDSMTVLPTPFLNIYWLVNFSGEQGLIGLTFDPDYASNGHFYVNYTQPYAAGHNTVIARFTVSPDNPNVADPNSEVVLMSIPQPDDYHKGGDLQFGPDGYLYLSIGDGGPQGDPENHAQSLNTRLGKILRIHPLPDGTWDVPPGNPFAAAGGDTLPEIFTYGVRNPFRISVDHATGDLWFGDVGQSSYEEVNFLPADTSGEDFGWHCYEGMMPSHPLDCPDPTALAWPVVTQANVMNGGTFCAIIGGKVYRGAAFPRLYGHYLYTDYCSGEIRSVRPSGTGGWLDEQLLGPVQPGNTTFGESSSGELFLGNQVTKRVYKVVDRCPMPPPLLTDAGDSLHCSPAASYAWYWNGTLLPDATGPALAPVANGQYWVVADMGGGCLFTTDTMQVIHTGIPAAAAMAIRLFPNPARDQVRITLPAGANGPFSLTLLDVTGRIVRQWPAAGNGMAELYVGDIAPGRYLLRGSTPSGSYCAALNVAR